MIFGAVADDLTGATDLGLMLARAGMSVVQAIGVPREGVPLPEADACVVALKSRTIPAAEAVAMSLASARALRAAGARQILFKYCSTFDSTDEGNIGPVMDALMDELGAAVTVACPAFPENGRSIYKGHLFVGDQLLSDSSMKDHPLTPMTDANLVRVLTRQSRREVGLVPAEVVEEGAEAIRAALTAAEANGTGALIVDALADRHLIALGEAVADLALITGGSGIAMGLPDAYRRRGLLAEAGTAAEPPSVAGRTAILAGSCSAKTLAQVAAAIDAGIPHQRLDPAALVADAPAVDALADWAEGQSAERPVLIASSDTPEHVRALQQEHGKAEVAEAVERTMGALAEALVARGFRRLIVAGGETSGAVIGALGVEALRIGREIDPGVPWTYTTGDQPLALALKSGNFGAEDFFLKADAVLA